MNIDGLSLGLVERALAAEVEGAQIQKLVQLDKHSLLFKLHGREGNRDLVITVGHTPACYISSTVIDLPKEPSALCMFLRKHVEGSRITKVSQLFGDRILQLSLSRLALDSTIETTDIYVELMGKYSNCIFVKEGLVLDALIHVSPLMNRERSIGPKQPYQLPPNAERMDLREMKDEEILPLLRTYEQDTVGATVRHVFNGFGTPVLKRVCELASDDGCAPFTLKTESALMSHDQWSALAKSLSKLRDAITGGLVVYVSADGKNVSPIALGTEGEKPHELAYLFPYMESAVRADGSINTAHHSLRKLITAAINKEEQRNKKIAAELADTENIDRYKEQGDLLMIYSYLPRTYDEEIIVDNVLIDPPVPISIALKPELTFVENAQYYYKQYTKLKNRTINGAYQLEQSTARIEYLNSILYGLEGAHSSHELEDIRLECMDAGLIKKSKKPVSFKIEGKNFLKFSIDGATVLIGRNNRQNDQLTHRVARPKDLWFHSLGFQGSHLILQTETEATDDQIAKAASYAAYFSKARESTKVPVDYTYVKNVKKPPASPLGYVTYTKQSTVYVDPIKPPDYKEN